MRITKKARREAKQLFHTCLVSGVIEEQRVRAAVGAVLERKPRGYLAILSHFTRLLKLDLQRRQATVESAVPLPGDLQQGIQGNLGRIYGPGLNYLFAQKPELIGGLRVQVGSDVYDGSVQARLAALRESF